MIIRPMIPIWLMAIICVLFLVMKRKGVFNYIRQILIVILLFVINLRLTIPLDVSQTEGIMGVDVLFVVDNTMSMLAEDCRGGGRRIDAVKDDCMYIIEQFPGASFSVVTFDNSVQVMTPYTTDVTMTGQVLNLLEGQTIMNAVGTSLNDVMEQMEGFLDNERDSYQIVFFITDGEDTIDNQLRNYSDLADYVDAGAVLGYGTKEGGRMRPVWYRGDEEDAEYLTYYDDNYNEEVAISKLDEDNLEDIASDLGVEYIHMTKQSKVDDVLEEILEAINPSEEDMENAARETHREYYYYFMIPLVVLLVYDFIYYRRRIFRRGQ